MLLEREPPTICSLVQLKLGPTQQKLESHKVSVFKLVAGAARWPGRCAIPHMDSMEDVSVNRTGVKSLTSDVAAEICK